MNIKRKSKSWAAGVMLTLAMLACTLPSGVPVTPTAEVVTATLPPLATAIVAPEDCIATANKSINMRTGPGTDWPTISKLDTGVSAKVTGHNGDRTWWQLNDSAWVSASLTTTSGDCSAVPVVGFPAPPVANNSQGGGGNNNNNNNQPTQQPTNSNPPTQAPTSAPATNLAFEVDYNITWFCGNDWRVSFIMYNQGNANIESVYYSVEGPPGSYLNAGTINNSPFESTPKESQPACAQAVGHGQSALTPGQGLYIPINLSPLPAGLTEGFLYIEACTQNNRGGTCESQILYFNFTT